MNREILFRGKRVSNGNWIEGYFVLLAINEGLKHAIYTGTDEGRFILFEVIPDTVGQFTGLCDKNGNKIFEGDILEVSYDDGTAYTTEVRAYGSTLCVDIEGEDYNFTAIDFAVDIWKDNCCEYKVIGNVFDNPELLEEL